MSKPASLHVLLALANSFTTQANAVRGDLKNTFEKKPVLFTQEKVVFQPLAEGAAPVVEKETILQTKVISELAFIAPHLAKQMDAQLQIAEANTRACADIVLEDGTVLATNVPATALLELEKRVSEVLDLAKAIPTLDPAKGYKLDPDQGTNVYKALVVTNVRTKKEKKVLTVAAATDKHPAQCQVYDEDIPVGTVQKTEFSGMITPAQKTEILSRVEVVLRGVKAARKVANEVTVDTGKQLGKALLAYAFNGTKP